MHNIMIPIEFKQPEGRANVVRARALARGHVVVEQVSERIVGPAGAHVGALAHVGAEPIIPAQTAGALLAGATVASYLFGYVWLAAAGAAGAIYFLVFKKDEPGVRI